MLKTIVHACMVCFYTIHRYVFTPYIQKFCETSKTAESYMHRLSFEDRYTFKIFSYGLFHFCCDIVDSHEASVKSVVLHAASRFQVTDHHWPVSCD